MTTAWQEAPLGEVCQFINRGISPAYVEHGGVAVLNQKCVRHHTVTFDRGRRHDSAVKKVPPERLVRAGDVLVNSTGTGTLGRVAQIREEPPEPTTVDSHVTIVRPAEGLFVPEFFGYALIAIEKNIQQGGEGCGGQTELSRSKLAEAYRIRFPVDHNEQRRIVGILDNAFEALATAAANAERNLDGAREIFEAVLQSTFGQAADGTKPATLGAVCKFVGGSQPPKSEFIGEPRDGYVRLIQIRDYKSDKNAVYIPKALARRFCEEDDVMIGRYGPPLFQILRGIEGAYNVALMKAVPDEAVISKSYLFHFLRHRDMLDYIIASSARAAGQIGLNKETIEPYPIHVPSLSAQAEIVSRVEQLEAATQGLARTYEQKLAALDELKNALLHQAFAGQLTSEKAKPAAAVLALPTNSPEFSANVIALAYERHKRQQRERTFGHVKEQKLLHLVEAIAKVDLGRQPMKDAAGPNDFPHMLKAEEWAKRNGFFEMVQREGGYDFKKLPAFDQLLAKAPQVLGADLARIESVIDLLVPMDTVDAEVLATVHAAWNNLLIDGAEITDAALIREARDGWHADKLAIPEIKFRQAIALIRSKGLVPDGKGKYVGGQTALL